MSKKADKTMVHHRWSGANGGVTSAAEHEEASVIQRFRRLVLVYDWLAFGFCCVVLLVAFYWPFLFQNANFFYTDATFWLEPICRFNATVLRSGHFPLWNNDCYCGMPEIGFTFPGLFYLPDYIFAVVPFSSALAISMVFHQSVAAVGMYLFLTVNKLSKWGAITGSAAYGLSGYMFGLPGNHSLIAGCAWLPVCLWFEQKLKDGNHRAPYCVGGAIAVSLLILSGRPEIVVPAIVVILAYLILLIVENGGIDAKTITWQARSLFIGFALAMPMIFPVGEWFSMSRRANGMLPSEVFMYSANWYDFFTMICGPALGELKQHGAVFRPLICNANQTPFVASPYLGFVGVTLAIWGLFGCPRKRLFFILTVFICGSVAALGDSTSIMPALTSLVPALSFVRFPVKLLFLPILSLSLLIAYGIDRCSALKFEALVTVLFWLAALTLAAAAIACALPGVQLQCLPFYNLGIKRTALLAQLHVGETGAEIAVLGLVLTIGCFVATRVRAIKTSLSAALSLLLIGTLLIYAFCHERMTAAADYFSCSSDVATTIKSLSGDQSSRVLNLCLERLTIPQSLLANKHLNPTIYEYQYDRQVLKPNCNIDFAIPSSFGFEGSMKGDYYLTLIHAYVNSSQTIHTENGYITDEPLWRFCQITGTRFVITQCARHETPQTVRPESLMAPRRFKLMKEDLQLNYRVYEVLGSHPRCFLTPDWQMARTHNQVLDTILGNFDVPDLAAVPFIEADSSMPPPRTSAARSDFLCDLTEHSSESLEIKTTGPTNALLVLADQNYPGWIAEVDGTPTPIYTANGFMRAVEVPVGKHVVHFKYEPTSLKLGFVIFALAVGWIIYLLAIYKEAK